MIYFGFNIANPWCRRWANVWNKVYDTWHPNKHIELEYMRDTSILSFSFRLTTRQDHAGLMIDLGLLGHCFSFNFYDSRHWNGKEGRWMIYNEENGEH